ncbi:hypothetical protein [Marinospirillum sp.]|uniref:hypothetical protein n=1 Tax=Marinospirillum sp. TaxID=2183934 RepID=UPI00287033C3|nr:hypothetical protein [Marinospirillum sp.]MDR9468412.1 hypothetical protein [Marinospirillum sp.]
MTWTLQGWLRQASQRLDAACLEAPRREAELLLCHLLKKNTAYLFTWPEQPLETLARATTGPLAQATSERSAPGLDSGGMGVLGPALKSISRHPDSAC